MDQLEKRGFVVYFTQAECCLWSFHDRLLETHALKSTRWRQPSGEPMTTAQLFD